MRNVIIFTTYYSDPSQNDPTLATVVTDVSVSYYYSKYLAMNGWRPIVLSQATTENDKNTMALSDIPSFIKNCGETIVHLPINPKETIGKKLLALSRKLKGIAATSKYFHSGFGVISTMLTGIALLFGDSHRSGGGWVQSVEEVTLSISNLIEIDAMIGLIGWEPPFIASKVHKITKIPWVMIYHDPWQQSVKPIGRGIAGYWLYKKILPSASQIFHCTPRWAKELSKELNRPVGCLINSYDLSAMNITEPKSFNKFTIVYTGSLDLKEYDPTVFFRCLSTMQQEIPDLAEKMEFLYIGRGYKDVTEKAIRYGIGDLVRCIAPLSNNDVLQYTKGAHLLLIILDQSNPFYLGRVLAKTPEYIGSGNPILLISKTINDTDTDLVRLIRDTGVGWVARNELEVKIFLRLLLSNYEKNGTTKRLDEKIYEKGDFTTEGKIAKLSKILSLITIGEKDLADDMNEYAWSKFDT